MRDNRSMFLRLSIPLVLMIVALAVPAWAENSPGVAAYDRGDYATALRSWRPLAEQGKAAGQFNLGLLYAYGQGVPQDYVQARQWWEKAGAQGHVKAQYNLGVLYNDGQGVPQHHALAKQWFEKAAEQGDAGAQVKLGILYLLGQGAPESDQMALFRFHRAAKQNDARAFARLGLMYEQGRGVPQDFIQAHMWYDLSVAHGEKSASGFRDALTQKMTPTQTAEARRLAREWKPKVP